jgi:hypothetical protein
MINFTTKFAPHHITAESCGYDPKQWLQGGSGRLLACHFPLFRIILILVYWATFFYISVWDHLFSGTP